MESFKSNKQKKNIIHSSGREIIDLFPLEAKKEQVKQKRNRLKLGTGQK